MRLPDWIAAWPGAELIRASGTAYLLVNSAHILGIALVVGAILPLDARLAGLGSFPLAAVAPLLIRTAGLGLALALATGAWLFSMKPQEYLANAAFLMKMGLIALAGLNVAAQHVALRHVDPGHRVVPWPARIFAILSAALWLGVLVAGRWIAFV